MKRHTKFLLYGTLLGIVIVLFNLGGVGLAVANLFQRNIQYGEA